MLFTSTTFPAWVRNISQMEDTLRKQIERHKAAIRRLEHSIPVKCLLRDQLVTAARGLFDFGCGHGDDLAGLTDQGIECHGFDPAFRPDAAKVPAPVVNLGFVLNVIEDVEERAATLSDDANRVETRLSSSFDNVVETMVPKSALPMGVAFWFTTTN